MNLESFRAKLSFFNSFFQVSFTARTEDTFSSSFHCAEIFMNLKYFIVSRNIYVKLLLKAKVKMNVPRVVLFFETAKESNVAIFIEKKRENNYKTNNNIIYY